MQLSRKKLSILPFLDESVHAFSRDHSGSPENHDFASKRRVSLAQMLAFTEKSVGIISERNREPTQKYLQVQSPVLIEEVEDENVVSVNTPCASEQKVSSSGNNTVGGGFAEEEGDDTSEVMMQPQLSHSSY